MREAYFENGWVTDPKHPAHIVGIRLGYDHCGEHVYAASEMESRLRLKVGSVAPLLHFERFMQRSFDAKVKAYPVALLVAGADVAQAQDFVDQARKTVKVLDPAKNVGLPLSRLMTAWGRDGIAIEASDEAGMAHLESLYERWSAGDVIVAPESMTMLFGQSGLSLAMASRLASNTATTAESC